MKKSNLTDYPNYRVSKRGKIIRLSDGRSTRNKSIIRNISKSRITLVKRKDYQKVSFDIPSEKLELVIKKFFGS
jgi:hypothetical protein